MIKRCVKHIAPWLILVFIAFIVLYLGTQLAHSSAITPIVAYALLAVAIGIISCGLFYLAKYSVKVLKKTLAAKKAKSKLAKYEHSSSSAKTFLVSGANRGIGLALTKALLAQGHHVIATARNSESLTNNSTLQELKNLRIETLDVAKSNSIHELSEKLEGIQIDCIINNAVMGPDNSNLMTIDPEHFEEAFKTNTSGPLRLTQAMMPNLLTSNEPKIINISSDLGSFGRANPCTLYAYQATKSALNMLTVLFDKELKYKGVISLAIHPGPVKTRLNVDGVISPEDSAKAIAHVIEKANKAQSGTWLDYQGETVPW